MAISARRNLVLWRHAEAEDVLSASNDFSRRLTTKGESQAAIMASWLKRHLPRDSAIICSPAVRAEQTAQALRLPYQINHHLLPEASISEVLEFVNELINNSNTHDVLLVGHQPWLGQVAAYFLQGSLSGVSIKKSAVWWLEQDLKSGCKFNSNEENRRFKLVAVQSPRFIID